MFSSITVIELANILAGPSVGMFFAELGASVIKIENVRSSGDTTRRWKLPSEDPADDVSAYFSSVNWGKRSIAVDLSSRPGKDILWHLVARADIVISSYKHGDAAKLGADYATLRSHKPNLIYGCIDGYGEHDQRTAFDAVLQAESGFMHMTGEPDGAPTKMPVALIDLLAAHQLKEGLLLALMRRDKTGEGSEVRTSLMHSAVASLANQMSGWLVAGVAPERMGSDHPSIAPYGTAFRTADDRYVVLGVGTDAQFRELCLALSLPEIADDDRFSSNQQRVINRTSLCAALAAAVSHCTSEDLLTTLAHRSIPAGLVASIPEVANQPSANDLRLRHASLEGTRTIAFTSDSIPRVAQLSPPPHFGEHTLEILSEIGYSPSTINALKLSGTVK